MQKILFIDMNALFPTLFWGNVITLIFLLIYLRRSRTAVERTIAKYLIAARLCHAFYYFVATGRGILPDFVSAAMGNSMVLVGFYMEAEAIMRIIREENKRASRQLQVILVVFVALFNLFEFIMPVGGIRIAITSFGNVLLMLLPVIRMFLSRDSVAFTRPLAVIYSVYLFLQLLRVGYALFNLETGILDAIALNSITFLALMLHLIIAMPAYTLIMKEYADEALLKMATTDKLTGAINRHAFLDAAVRVHRQCVTFKTPLSVLFLDIDHFKMVNDKYGHAFGDAVLVRLTEIIENSLRASDLSCRYGGEEFVVLLSRADIEAAGQVSERIMAGVRAARFPGEPGFSFAVSIGVYSGVPLPGHSLEESIQYADEALYRAKQTGRDRVVFSALCDGVEAAAAEA